MMPAVANVELRSRFPQMAEPELAIFLYEFSDIESSAHPKGGVVTIVCVGIILQNASRLQYRSNAAIPFFFGVPSCVL